MLRFLRPLVLFAAAAGLTAAAGLPAAPAQVKKDDKGKVDPKADAGTIVVSTDKKGEWRFKVVVDGKSIAIGTDGFEKKEEVMKVIETLKTAMAKAKVEVIDDKKK